MRKNLTKQEILRTSSDIRTVFKRGEVIRRNNVTVIMQRKTTGTSRILAIVKKSRNAVNRNLGKRRVKEAFRNRKPLFAASFDMIVIVVEKIPSFRDISAAIHEALSRRNLILQE